MTHIQFRFGGVDEASGDRRPACVRVDGVDITDAVLAEGFGIELNHKTQRATVALRLRVDRLDIDLPDVLLEATRDDDDTSDTTQTEV